MLYFDTKKGMNELEKRFLREGGAANLSIFFNLVLRCFTKTGGSIDLCLSLLRRYWPNLRIKLRRRSGREGNCKADNANLYLVKASQNITLTALFCIDSSWSLR